MQMLRSILHFLAKITITLYFTIRRLFIQTKAKLTSITPSTAHIQCLTIIQIEAEHTGDDLHMFSTSLSAFVFTLNMANNREYLFTDVRCTVKRLANIFNRSVYFFYISEGVTREEYAWIRFRLLQTKAFVLPSLGYHNHS